MRNSAIEIYRVLLMMGIVTIHLFSHVGMGHHWIPRLCTTCVVGFVFISGYFGIKFSWYKLVKIYGVALFCALWCGVSIWMNEGGAKGLYSIVSCLRVWWFVNAYIMLMLMTPMINYAMELCKSRKKLVEISLPVVVLVFGWEFLTIIPGVREWIPADRGFGTSNGLTLVGIYVAARCYRLLELERRFSSRVWFVVWIVSGIICALNFGKYNSPFALLFVAASFTFMKWLGESSQYYRFSRIGEVCRFLGPSMLSVYLIHVGGVIHLPGWRPLTVDKIWSSLSGGGGGSVYPRLFWMIVAVFVICVAIDLLRRSALALVKLLKEKRN